jgi:hypothetical protein
MKPIAWYDPSNGMVSTDQDCPLFTPLGQVWGLYLKEEASMTKDEALRLALEALEYEAQKGNDNAYQFEREAIKAALEANEFNPDWDTQAVLTEEIQRMAKRIEELEAKDKPYALEASMFSNDRVKIDPVTGNVSIGTPQRTWVGLTDKEILVKCESVPDYDIGNHDLIQFAKAIEAKLKAKNT